MADDNKILTNGKKYAAVITVPADEVDNWYEIDDVGQG